MPKLGTHLSQESIELMRKNKLKKLLSKYKWELVEPYLDAEIDLGSRNRSKKFITLREFKELLEEGKNIREISKITSKHLAIFYSKFSQGAIELSKEEFAEEYEKGLSLVEIAEKHNISKDSITFLRQLYGKKNKGAKYIERKKTEVPLTQYQKEILYGTMLGDAKRLSPSSVAFGHSEKQKDYLLWKYEIFRNVSSENSLKCSISFDGRSERKVKSWGFYTYANTDVERCIMDFYQSGKKEVNRVVLDNLSPASLATWFCDDGKTDFGYRSIVRGMNPNPSCKLCTESFSKESCENIKDWFKEEYDIEVYLKEKQLSNGMGYRIAFGCENTKKFFDLIREHVPLMFNYKIDIDTYLKQREEKENETIGGKDFNCPLGAAFSSLDLKKQDYYINNLVDYFQEQGIEFLIHKPAEWKEDMNDTLNYNVEKLIANGHINFIHLGNRFLMSHFPNFWKAKAKGSMSPKEVFENKSYLSEIMRSIIIEGNFPNEDRILRKLRRYRGNKQVSGFMPLVAKAIYHKHCEEGTKIFDFCGGYGGRLFGALACDKIKSYTATEVNFESFCGLNDLYRTLRVHADIDKEVNLFNQDSILGMKQFSDQSFDFCFTSPPYYSTEEYSQEDNQSFKTYSTYGDWFEGFLLGSINEARRICKKVAINIDNSGGYKLADDLRNWLNSERIEFIEDKIRYPQYGGNWKFEPIFVF